MSEAVMSYAKKYAEEQSAIVVIKTKIETIKNLLAMNLSLNDALKATGLDKETYEKYSADDSVQETE